MRTVSPLRRPTKGALPNLVIIGGMKCGTTSLHQYLDQHPDIAMSTPKEIHYFLERNAHRSPDWYAAHFDAAAAIRGEASPGYTKYPQRPGVPERMYKLLPDAKLIYILRDPIERTVSQYLHEYTRHADQRSLSQALASMASNTYVDPSRYHMQLQRFLEFYPLSRILVIATEDLRDDPQGTLRTVTEFLGVDPFEFDVVNKANVAERRGRTNSFGRMIESPRAKKIGRRLPRLLVEAGKVATVRLSAPVPRPRLDPALRQALAEALRDDVAQLRALTHLPFEKWSI